MSTIQTPQKAEGFRVFSSSERNGLKTTLVQGLVTGVWRRHSWAVRDDNIIETIAKADYYFGIELDEREAVKFWLANLHVYRYPHWAPSASYVHRHARIFQKIEEYGLLENAGI